MALIRNEDPRAAKLASLADYYGIAIKTTIDDCMDSAEEDLFLHLFYGDNGEEPEYINRWCAVTRSGELTYLYPTFVDREGAEERASEYAADNIYAESPVAIVDLDGEGECGDIYPLAGISAVFSHQPEVV